MEARQILIANTKTQRRYAITSSAVTLGQLKEDMTNAGIDYDDDMDFTEGVSKTTLNGDDSILPTNIQHTNRETGEVTTTNNLVILLTNTKKKISSGASRAEVYNLIKERGLQKKVFSTFGKNYTLCKTSELEEILEDGLDTPSHDEESCDCLKSKEEKFLRSLDIIEEDLESLRHAVATLRSLQEDKEPEESIAQKVGFSDDEIDDMIAGL